MFSRQETHGDTHVCVFSVCDAASVLVKGGRPDVVGTDAGHSQRHSENPVYRVASDTSGPMTLLRSRAFIIVEVSVRYVQLSVV
jgi:hypothetical protein